MVSHYPWYWPDGRPARFQDIMPRLLTYNVHRCVGVDRKLDVARIVGVIAEHEPDIVCLQELDVGRARTGHVDQARSIADGLAMTFHFNAAMKVEAEQYGDAILTPHHPGHTWAGAPRCPVGSNRPRWHTGQCHQHPPRPRSPGTTPAGGRPGRA